MQLLKYALIACTGACILASPVAAADARGQEAADFIKEYLRVWNTFDAKALATRIYRIPGETEAQAEARFAKTFADLKAQGYGKSVATVYDGCLLTPDSGYATMRFARYLANGQVMGPAERQSMYQIKRFPDGWRIVGTVPISASTKLSCSSATS